MNGRLSLPWFSSKIQDEETGLYYYGFRYFDSSNGRWLTRDPVAELGGYNLYNFLQNSPILGVDVYGLSKMLIPTEMPNFPTDSRLDGMPFGEPDYHHNFKGVFIPDATLWLLFRFPNKIREERDNAQRMVSQSVEPLLDSLCKYRNNPPTVVPVSPEYFSLFVPNAYHPDGLLGGAYLAEYWSKKPYTGPPLTKGANEHPDDCPMSPFEAYSTLGRFPFRVREVTVEWMDAPPFRAYEWEGVIEVWNRYGVNRGDGLKGFSRVSSSSGNPEHGGRGLAA